MIYVLAFNARHAKTWATANGIPHGTYPYVGRASDLHGLTNIQYVTVHGWRSHPDADMLAKVLNERIIHRGFTEYVQQPQHHRNQQPNE